MSKPEVDLWVRLRRNVDGFHFRRQHPIGPFVADFYCAKAKLIIEVDSYVHSTEVRGLRDEARDAYFLERQIETMRLDAADIYKDADEVALGVLACVRDKLERRV